MPAMFFPNFAEDRVLGSIDQIASAKNRKRKNPPQQPNTNVVKGDGGAIPSFTRIRHRLSLASMTWENRWGLGHEERISNG